MCVRVSNSMFKKSKRSFRQRTRQSDSEDEDVNKEEAYPKGSAAAATEQVESDNKGLNKDNDSGGQHNTKWLSSGEVNGESNDSNTASGYGDTFTDKTKASVKLSFQEDDEEETFVVKKSVYSRRMERNKKKLLKSTLQTAEESEKTKSDINNFSSKEVFKEKDKDLVEEDANEHYEQIVCPGSDEEEMDNDDAGLRPNYQKPSSVHQFSKVLQKGIIPDAKMIYELKKQRQKLAGTFNKDFIPLEDAEEELSKADNSRLLREEDDDKSDDPDQEDKEDDERILFGKVDYVGLERAKAKEAFRFSQESREHNSQHKSNGSVSNEEPDESEDEENSQHRSDDSEDEFDRWEREQIRKAVRVRSLHSDIEFQNRFLNDNNHNHGHHSSKSHTELSEDNHNVVPIEVDTQAKFGSHTPSYLLANDATRNDLEVARAKRAEYRCQLEANLEEHKQLLDRISMDLRLTAQDLEGFLTRDKSLEEDCQFYLEIGDFVRNLCECVHEKWQDIEQCELMALDLFQNDNATRCEAVRKSVKEQHMTCLQLIISHKASDFNNRNQLLKRVQFDQQQHSSHTESDSSDEEQSSPQEAEKRCKQLEEIQTKLRLIFDDADDAYASVSGVLKPFETWKLTRLGSYKESFVGQFVEKFLHYYIRHELVLWNPFQAKVVYQFIELPGMRSLSLFGATEISDNDCPSSNDKQRQICDLELIPNLLDTTILARLCALLERQIWNPFSTRQTARLVRFLTSLLSTCPSLVDSSPNLAQLFKLIVLRVESCIQTNIAPFMPPDIPADLIASSGKIRNNEESILVAYVTRFVCRQFNRTAKLFANVITFRHLISEDVLKEFALGQLLDRFLLLFIIRSSACSDTLLRQVEHLVGLLPRDWCQGNRHPAVTRFAGLIQQLVNSSDNRSADVQQKLTLLRLQLLID